MKLKIFRSFVVLIFAIQTIALGESGSHKISGKVTAERKSLANAFVGVFKAGIHGANLVAFDETDRHGRYSIGFQPSAGELYYLLAEKDELTLVAALGRVDSSHRVEINELTTVASVFALSQFMVGTEIFGPLPGLDNAMATTVNLVKVQNGKPASIISNSLNGVGSPTSTLALQTQNSLANMLAACAVDSGICAAFFELTTVNGQTPTNTMQAMHNIARNPVSGLDNELLFLLATIEETYQPGLTSAPAAWMLALHFTKGGFSAPGRHAFDSQGNLWSNNNFALPSGAFPTTPGKQISILDPSGKPILGSPRYSQFVSGSGYGTAIAPVGDESVWISNFDPISDWDVGSLITQFSPQGKVLNVAGGLNYSMGMAFDHLGNLWIANMGDPGEPDDFGSVTVFLGGDPDNRVETTDDDGIHKPFSVAIDDEGRAWAANGADAVGSVTVLELSQDNELVVVKKGITSLAMMVPQDDLRPFGPTVGARTIAIDSNGHGWVNNFYTNHVTFIDADRDFHATDYSTAEGSHGWGLAVDGNDVVWAQSFSNPPGGPQFHKPPTISVIQGAEANRGDPLFAFSNPSLQHVTALQIDPSGNVWVANNWSLETSVDQMTLTPIVIGGDGMVQFIGLATPVLTPLIGQPVDPADLL